MGTEIHALSSASKPLASWIARDAIQECREACGGHGYFKGNHFIELLLKLLIPTSFNFDVIFHSFTLTDDTVLIVNNGTSIIYYVSINLEVRIIFVVSESYWGD